MLYASQNEQRDVPATVDRLDGRTSNVRRLRKLVAAYARAIGEPLDELMKTQVQRAAELQIIAEDLRKARLRGVAIDPAALIRAENLSDRARKALPIGIARSPNKPATLRDYLARRAAETAT